MSEVIETATCRGCRKALRGKPYYMGGFAYHPVTGDQCKVNFYGGYVCSAWCDRRASLDQEADMPGGGHTDRLSRGAQDSYNRNWEQS